jgi:hypothetical protein
MTRQHCGTCQHWVLATDQPVVIGTRNGRCTEGPPGIVAVPGVPGQQVTVLAMYPIVAETFVACARYAPMGRGAGEEAQPETDHHSVSGGNHHG